MEACSPVWESKKWYTNSAMYNCDGYYGPSGKANSNNGECSLVGRNHLDRLVAEGLSEAIVFSA